MPITAKRNDGSTVAVYLPDDWGEARGDVCLYPDTGLLCFVRRDEAGYSSVPVFEWPPTGDELPQKATLTPEDAWTVADQINLTVMGILPAERDRIVASSMRVQNTKGEK